MGYSLKDILKSLKVLFVSKEINISPKEVSVLEHFFHKIIISHSAERAYKIFSIEHPDVIVTDINLSNINGIDLCKKIRKINHSVPIIILSKEKNEKYLFEAIRIQVIDFVIRPVKIENLIFALNQTAKHIVNHGNVTISLQNGSIYDYHEKTIFTEGKNTTKLTKNEFRLLELFLANKHKTLSREDIENYLWANEEITESAFKSLYSRLRNKIGKDSIKNVFGIGYQLT
ncbi:response regulator transcription factor [Arcobacter sp. LA11]|uniref:response regulator transcription factor n=1 Tax=Arcobacter sp. LA11 TaxID=1898176 RepID=UPI000933B6CE|nr:response regulator transcription factor [Arcobacter sp. LA11]